jgi:hypothetical protein
MNFASRLIALEMGQMDEDEAIALIEELVEAGIIWELQGSYQRLAQDLGLI